MVLQGETKEVVIDEEDVFWIKGRVCVPRIDDLTITNLVEAYNLSYYKHLPATKMYCDLRQYYCRNRMKHDMVDFVAQCMNCQHVNYKNRGLEEYFREYLFLNENGKDLQWTLWVTYNVEKLVKLYIYKFVQLHGVSIYISDRVTQFTSNFWRTLQAELGTKLDLSTTFLPQGTGLLRKLLEKVKFIQEKLLASQSRQKKYADRKVKDLEFMEIKQVLLKVSPMKGVMRFVLVDENLSYEEEPVAIIDREVHKLRSKEIAVVKVQWKKPLGRMRMICTKDIHTFFY
ncbi:uncharacterized protein LOC125855885 [Solanum stenotomum]|uniref:uncharacterized protein LOC125855885 n=1 Tax=Solanum stenotomum TaxID=172797 RepID=UPI0020D109D6|nr:uncharacterized protein LOC125855885 [Solanum stenotomum]